MGGGELNLARETVIEEAILHISHGTGSPKRSYPPNSRIFIQISCSMASSLLWDLGLRGLVLSKHTHPSL